MTVTRKTRIKYIKVADFKIDHIFSFALSFIAKNSILIIFEEFLRNCYANFIKSSSFQLHFIEFINNFYRAQMFIIIANYNKINKNFL